MKDLNSWDWFDMVSANLDWFAKWNLSSYFDPHFFGSIQTPNVENGDVFVFCFNLNMGYPNTLFKDGDNWIDINRATRVQVFKEILVKFYGGTIIKSENGEEEKVIVQEKALKDAIKAEYSDKDLMAGFFLDFLSKVSYVDNILSFDGHRICEILHNKMDLGGTYSKQEICEVGNKLLFYVDINVGYKWQEDINAPWFYLFEKFNAKIEQIDNHKLVFFMLDGVKIDELQTLFEMIN